VGHARTPPTALTIRRKTQPIGVATDAASGLAGHDWFMKAVVFISLVRRIGGETTRTHRRLG
jgi:hypothetical protein